MKKILLFFGLLVVAGGVSILFRGQPSINEDYAIATQSPVRQKMPVSTDKAISPQQLIIPKLGIVASVEYVGMDAKGNMDVPKQDENVAWYELGYKPGALGNSVIAGHFDTKTGAPAVFYRLETLEKGDSIQVIGTDGTENKFIVTQKHTYPYDMFPLIEVFGPADKPRLNLITCEGTYNSANRTYSHRTVVYSELSE